MGFKSIILKPHRRVVFFSMKLIFLDANVYLFIFGLVNQYIYIYIYKDANVSDDEFGTQCHG